MTSIAQEAGLLLVQVRVRVVNPQPPGLNLLSDLQVLQNLLVEIGIRRQELFHWSAFRAPLLSRVITLIPREETVIRQQATAIARRQDDLVPLSFLATPVLESGILGVVDEAETDGFFGGDVAVQAGLFRRSPGWDDAYFAADC